MDKFAFIGHPTNFQNLPLLLGKWSFLNRILSQGRLKQIIKNLAPYKLFYIDSIISTTGRKIAGYGIVCPFFPEQMVSLKKGIVIKKILAAIKLAQSLGVKMVGLGGFTSVVTNGGDDLVDNITIAITSGNTYTTHLTIEGVLEATKMLEVDLKRSVLVVIGATGDIGSVCAKVFSDKVGHLFLVARDQDKLSDFVRQLKKNNDSTQHIEIFKYATDVISCADIIITATSAITTLIEPEHLKPGSIVCDVSVPPNIARRIFYRRPDVLVFEGGLALLPNAEVIKNRSWQRLFPNNLIFGCLAETILLSLEGMFENFSIGRGNITIEKINRIKDISNKHGFKLAPFICGHNFIDDNRIRYIKDKIYAKRA